MKQSRLTAKEKIILQELRKTYKKSVNLYLDLTNVFTDWPPKDLRKVVYGLQEMKLVQYLPSEDVVHCLCRITPLGLETLRVGHLTRQIDTPSKLLVMALVILAVTLSVFGYQSMRNSDKSMADVTGIGLNNNTKAILANWIEGHEGQNSDHYTFDLLEDWGDRKTYFVECKMEHLRECKYNIVFVELNETKKEIINVEIAHD